MYIEYIKYLKKHIFIHALACLAPRFYHMHVRNFSELQTDAKTRKSNQIVVFGSLKGGIKGSPKEHIWKEIAIANSAGVDSRSPDCV